MSAIKTYPNATAFRTALETRLKNVAREEGVDLQRFRRQAAFDRLLCRLFSEPDPPWALKGGYGMELRLQVARATRDIDLTFRNIDLLLGRNEQKNQVILDLLQKAVSVDLEDYFVFLIGEPMMNLDSSPYGGARYPVEARMDGRAFVKFHIDVGVGDLAIEPLDNVKGRDWLNFIGIPSGSFPVISASCCFISYPHGFSPLSIILSMSNAVNEPLTSLFIRSTRLRAFIIISTSPSEFVIHRSAMYYIGLHSIKN